MMKSIGLFLIILFQQICVLYVTSSDIKHITANVGQEVTLRLPERETNRYITDVAWIRKGGNHIATTTPDGHVVVRNPDYKGRLRSSNGASLTITNVAAGDQGVYSADVLFSDEDSYVQKYHLSVLDAVTPHTYPLLGPCSAICRTNGINVTLTCNQTSPQDVTAIYDTCTCGPWKADCAPCVLDKYCGTGGNRTVIIVSCVLSALLVVVLLLLYCFCWRKKKPSPREKFKFQMSKKKLEDQESQINTEEEEEEEEDHDQDNEEDPLTAGAHGRSQ